MSQSRNWCFTLNNYSDDDVRRINNLVETNNHVVYLIYGKEISESRTPHLQGFVQTKNKIRMSSIKEIIGGRPHIENARNVNASIQYCKKEGDWYEFGNRTSGAQGSRSDLEKFKTAVQGGMLDLKELREEFSEVLAKYPGFCVQYVRDKIPKPVVEKHTLFPWQQTLFDNLNETPDDRSIRFIVDPQGNKGKTWFAKFYCSLYADAQLMEPAKKADMAYALQDNLRVLFVNVTRQQQQHFQYSFFESLKDGYVFSPKYMSQTRVFSKVHVVVLMNEHPQTQFMSKDRWENTITYI